jgi:uncharacterized coiled-coil protein SlyX
MIKGNDKKFNQIYMNEEDEVNIRDFPYYRTIPIQSVADKQRQIQQDKNDVESKSKEYKKQAIIPAVSMSTIYQNPVVENLPTFNLVRMEGSNSYRVDMTQFEERSESLKKLEEQLGELEEKIKRKSDTIEGQNHAIAANDLTIQQQIDKINSNNKFIQQQTLAYNHNIYVINNLASQYSVNNNEINKQQEILTSQYNQISEYQTQVEQLCSQVQEYQNQLEQLYSQVQDYQNQLSYHGTMLSAFNTLIQNPAYFTQLMTAASMASFSPGMITEVNDVQQSELNTT